MLCDCGYVMSDVQAPCPTTGDLLGDVADEVARREWRITVNEFIAAVVAGRRDAWLVERNFSPAAYPTTDNASVVEDLIGLAHDPRSKRVWECERCGRLHVQARADSNEWRSFRPESPGDHGPILAAVEAV